jgi:methionine-rich copper-binding protein CopC
MKHALKLGALLAVLAGAPAAYAHAFLDHAQPGVGGSVSGAPSELVLSFSQNIVPAFSGVTLKEEGGPAVAVGKAVLDPGSQNTLHVKIGKALKPGTYLVSWHVVSVDTHPTSGTYKFTVAP